MQEVYNELEENRPKVETVLAQGQEYLKKSPPGAAGNLQTNLRTLKQRWDNVTARANDKKIKLEIALKEATEFHDALQVILIYLLFYSQKLKLPLTQKLYLFVILFGVTNPLNFR